MDKEINQISGVDKCMFIANMGKKLLIGDDDYDTLMNEIEKFWEEDDRAAFATDPDFHQPQKQSFDGVAAAQEQMHPMYYCLQLRLNKTPSLMRLLEETSARNSNISACMPRPTESNVTSRSQTPLPSKKLKASNFPMTTITIGNWQRMSTCAGELTAKVYYAKKKLVWEFLDLDGDLKIKSKMEMTWSDITAIEAVMLPNQPGMLQIELDKPPLFFRENPPEPRKHTTWDRETDFTGGEATHRRRQRVIFPSGVLDKHYEQLLQCDKKLQELSRKPFPIEESPFDTEMMQFDMMSALAAVDFNGAGPSCYVPKPPSWSAEMIPVTDLMYLQDPSQSAHAFPNLSDNLMIESQNWNLHEDNLMLLHDIEKCLLAESQILYSDHHQNPSFYFPNDINSGLMSGVARTDQADQVMMLQNPTANNVPIMQPTAADNFILRSVAHFGVLMISACSIIVDLDFSFYLYN